MKKKQKKKLQKQKSIWLFSGKARARSLAIPVLKTKVGSENEKLLRFSKRFDVLKRKFELLFCALIEER